MFAPSWYQQFQLAQPPIDEIRPLLGQDKTTWTQVMTRWVVQTCEKMGWAAVARGHRTPILPIEKSELLSVDVMAFPAGASRWSYPIAAIELENQPRDDYIAYDLWKLLCLRVSLRLVYCYRPLSEQGSSWPVFSARNLSARSRQAAAPKLAAKPCSSSAATIKQTPFLIASFNGGR